MICSKCFGSRSRKLGWEKPFIADNNKELEGEAFFDDSFNQWVAENNKIGLDIGRIHLHPLMDESTIMDLKDD